MEAYNYSTEIVYQSPGEIGEYIIDGEKLKDFFVNLEITFRCF